MEFSILMVTAEAFGQETENLIINRTSLERQRTKFREARHEEI